MSGAWINITSGQPISTWACVASSYTGQYVLAGNNTGNLWFSSDYGATWAIPSGSPTSQAWGGVAINADATIQAACDNIGTASGNANVYLYQGGSWSTITSIGNSPDPELLYWTSIAVSIDNLTIAASSNTVPSVWVYTLATSSWTQTSSYGNSLSSNIFGYVSIGFNNWPWTIYSDGIGGFTVTTITGDNSNLTSFDNPNPGWTSISSSLDGQKLAMCAQGNNYIYTGILDTDTNYWTFTQQTAPGAGEWLKVQFGPDNVSIVACSRNGSGTSGTIWLGAYNGASYSWSQQVDGSNQPLLGDWISISRNLDRNVYTKFVAVTYSSLGDEDTGVWIFTSTQTAAETIASFPCFKEDTLILTDRGYLPIQSLKTGDLVKTVKHDFVPIHMIGKKDIHHIASNQRIKDQLYQCSPEQYPEVIQDLILTGCHCILVSKFASPEQRAEAIRIHKGRLFVTDNHYRLPACADDRATIFPEAGVYTIYHLALENNDYYMNYGIYANGLLVETCSKRYLKELSGMKILP